MTSDAQHQEAMSLFALSPLVPLRAIHALGPPLAARWPDE
jgi:hypothetical protein